MVILTFASVCTAVEISYDDGTSEGSWSIGSDPYPYPPDYVPNGGSDGQAIMFSPVSSSSLTLNTVKVYGRRYGDDINMRIEIWDQDTNIIYSNVSKHSAYFTTTNSWVSIPVPSIVVSGDFYAVLFTNSYIPSSVPTTGVYIGYDSSSSTGRSYKVENNHAFRWTLNTPRETTNWMIRIVGDSSSAPTPTATPTPTLNPTPTVTLTPTPASTLSPEVVAWDANRDNIIQKSEAVAAIVNYFTGGITKANAIAVVLAYFRG